MKVDEMYDEQLFIPLELDSEPKIDEVESELVTDLDKNNIKLPGTEKTTYYGEDKWVYASDESYYFDDVDYVYKDYVKDYVRKHKSKNYAVSSTKKYYGYLKQITKFLIDNNVLDGISITSETIDLFNEHIKKKYRSEGTRTHYRRIFKDLLSAIEVKKGQNYKDLIEVLSKNDTRLLKVETQKGKTPNIPQDIFYKIINIATKEIEDDSIDYEGMMGACCTLLLSQTGMRIGELALLEADKLNMYPVTDGTKVGYIDMWALKEAKYISKTKSVCFMTSKAILAYKTLEKLTAKERESEERISFFKDPEKKGTGNIIRNYIYDFYTRNYVQIGLLNNDSPGFRIETFEPKKQKQGSKTYDRNTKIYNRNKDILPEKIGSFFLGFPRPHQFRVAVCNELIRQGVDLGWVMQHMNHLTPEMTDYYVRNENEEREASENVLRDIVSGSYRLIGEEAEDLTERINEFIEENEFNIEKDLDSIVTILKGKIPIREKKEGFCIKSSFGRACKRNEFTCAFDMCNNFCTSYLFSDITYKRFKDLKRTIEYNTENGFIKEAGIEKKKIKRLVVSRLSKEIDETEYEIKHQGVDKILKDHPELDYIVNNIDSIRKEINLWI